MKKIGSVLFIAGTCIGGGMIALPIVLVKIGLLPGILIIIFVWLNMYFSSLVNLDLNINAGRGKNLGDLGKHYSGSIAGFIGSSSTRLLSFSLLSAFIYGASSIFKNITQSSLTIVEISIIISCFAIILLLFPIRVIELVNRIFFSFLIVIMLLLLLILFSMIKLNNLPLITEFSTDIKSIITVTSVIFTSFGFQIIFHVITDYCNKNPSSLKTVFFFGSLIPCVIYIFWSISVVGVIYNYNNILYEKMKIGNIDVGGIIYELSVITKSEKLKILIWLVSLLAILTSLVGVSSGICSSFTQNYRKYFGKLSRFFSSLITILIPLFISLSVPKAFITILSFSGMLVSIIAIILPLYLLTKLKSSMYFYSENKNQIFKLALFFTGIIIFCLEISKIISSI